MKEMLNVFWERLSENWLDIIYKKWKEIPSVYWKSFFIVFIGVNIAFAAYTFAFIGGDHFLTEGRFIRPIAFNTLTYIGRFADQYIPFLLTRSLVLPVLTAFYGFLGLSLGAIALCVYWRVPKSFVSYSIVGLLVSIQPYTLAWVWSFFVMIEMLWIPVCVIAAYILAEKAGSHGKIKKIVYISLSVLLFIIPLGTHQSTINIMAIVFLGRIIIDIFLEWDATVSSLKKIVLKFRYSVLAAGLGGFLYGFIFLLLKFNGIIPTGNGDYHLRTFTGFSDFAANFIKIIDISFTRMWQYPAPFFPPSLIKSFAIISYCGFILVLLNIFIDNTKTKNQKFIKGIVITIFILFIIAFSNIMAMLTPVDFVANSPRILFLSVPFLCVLPIVLFLIQRFQFPKNVIIVACIVLINMCLIQDSLVVRVWKNGYEAEKMLWNRLIMRIE
ncbi:MAG: hypothetical protein LBT79_03490, partial [Elusimicrobiota bacterium]|nr:hypothetical protein [Elusimicrobiota bacterium]